MSRPCKLQINSAGAWRDLLRFEVLAIDRYKINDGTLQDAAVALVEIADPAGRTSLRICTADVLPSTLAHWSAKTGWSPA